MVIPKEKKSLSMSFRCSFFVRGVNDEIAQIGCQPHVSRMPFMVSPTLASCHTDTPRHIAFKWKFIGTGLGQGEGGGRTGELSQKAAAHAVHTIHQKRASIRESHATQETKSASGTVATTTKLTMIYLSGNL